MTYDFCQRCVRTDGGLILFRPTSQIGVARLYRMSDEELVALARQNGLIK